VDGEIEITFMASAGPVGDVPHAAVNTAATNPPASTAKDDRVIM
jgi:hypothetical protein